MTAPSTSIDFEEIKNRWSERKWPSIGYFVHGQAYDDIQKLIKMVEANDTAHTKRD